MQVGPMDDGEIFTLLNALICLISITNRTIAATRKRKRNLLQLACHESSTKGAGIERGPYCKLRSPFLFRAVQEGSLDLRRDFRLSRRAFAKLSNIVRDDKVHGWQTEIEVLLFLFWLACGCAYRVVARSCGVPTTTVFRVVHKQLHNITSNLNKFIHFPKQETYDDITQGFSNLAGTPAIGHALGAIDGTHVRIIPPTADKTPYVNRKCQHTIQTQAVCDHQGMFIDVFSGYPGSVHDARVYRSSPIVMAGIFPPRGFYLLGDTAYPGSRSLITPFKEPEASRPVNRRYNYHHSKARCIIERAFGELKVRWRCIFTKVLELRSSSAPEVIAACCAMHNLCREAGDIMQVDDPEVDDEDGEANNIENDDAIERLQDTVECVDLRASIAQMISAPAQYPQHLSGHDYFILSDGGGPIHSEQ